MRAVAARLIALLGLFPVAGPGCSNGASSDSGQSALLRLAGAQFIPGELGTEAAAAAPTVQAISTTSSIVFPGAAGRPLGGSANAASAVLIGLEGDTGHWVVPTGAPDFETPGAFLFQTSMSFSPLLPLLPSDRNILFRAVDAQGSVGPALIFNVKVQALTAAGSQPPLLVTLHWDTDADLDLKVRVPNPADPTMPLDVWTKSRIALPPVANGDPPYTADQIMAAGQLDFDSNSQCVIDGVRQEDVTFTQPPPSGDYEVRVDAFSLCGQPTARWHALAFASGMLLAEAYGQVGIVDTQGSHGPATGTLAFSFTVP